MQARIVPVPRYGRLEGDPATASSAEGQVATVGDQEEETPPNMPRPTDVSRRRTGAKTGIIACLVKGFS